MTEQVDGWTRVPDAEDDETPEVFSHDYYGNIVRSGGQYQAMLPAIFSLGPFDTVEEAKKAVLLNYDVILKLARSFDPKMLNHIESLRREEQYRKEER